MRVVSMKLSEKHRLYGYIVLYIVERIKATSYSNSCYGCHTAVIFYTQQVRLLILRLICDGACCSGTLCIAMVRMGKRNRQRNHVYHYFIIINMNITFGNSKRKYNILVVLKVITLRLDSKLLRFSHHRAESNVFAGGVTCKLRVIVGKTMYNKV